MSGNGKEKPEVTPEVIKEVTPEVSSAPDMAQVGELYEYAIKALQTMRQQQQDIAIQIERQVGMVSALEILVEGKTSETLTKIRSAIEKEKMQGA